jgi:choline kinase
MHGVILAGGEGSRLLADGVATPKPLVRLAGRTQLARLATTLHRLGCSGVSALVRAEYAGEAAVAVADVGGWLRIVPCSTPSSLHTLAAAVDAAPPGPLFCTMVDTVMPPSDWRLVYTETSRRLADGAAAVLAVTPYVDDESALWVKRDAAGRVVRLGSEPVDPPCVTGGVYGLAASLRPRIVRAVAGGMSRLRRFLGSIVEDGLTVATVNVPRIIDLDRRRDLEQARAWYTSPDLELFP